MRSTLILLIEDNDPLHRSMDRSLEAAGFSVQAVSDGPTGLALLNSTTPDLVLLDVALGEDSGIDVLREIRRKNAALPVIIVTEDMGKAVRALARDPDLPTIFDYAGVRQRILRDWQIVTEVFPSRSWVYYGDASNNIVVVPEWPAPEGYDLRERPWYRAAIATEGIAWVEPYADLARENSCSPRPSRFVPPRERSGACWQSTRSWKSFSPVSSGPPPTRRVGCWRYPAMVR